MKSACRNVSIIGVKRLGRLNDEQKTLRLRWAGILPISLMRNSMQAALLRSAKSSAGAVGAIAKFTVFTSATGFETRCDGWRKGLKDTKDTHRGGLKCIFCRLKRRNCAVRFWEGSGPCQRAIFWNNSRTCIESKASFACIIILNSLDI